jgi:hypothetical protein
VGPNRGWNGDKKAGKNIAFGLITGIIITIIIVIIVITILSFCLLLKADPI